MTKITKDERIVGDIHTEPKSMSSDEYAHSKLIVDDWVVLNENTIRKNRLEDIRESIEENIRLGYMEYVDVTENLPWTQRKFRLTEKGKKHAEELIGGKK